MSTMDGTEGETHSVEELTPAQNVFIAPSIRSAEILTGLSYAHYSGIPDVLELDMSTECVLGVDEAGRGPVIGPMVYSVFYLPLSSHRSLLAETHHFDDSKVLKPEVRSALMETLCTSSTDLFQTCGWAIKALSARDISSNMLLANGVYNLNAQAMDATIELIQGVLDRGINVKEIYVDALGNTAVYQKRLERIFPTAKITVEKKADSLYPCVSAASVCAKVTRDAALEVCYESYGRTSEVEQGWGSGYPSDSRTSSWLKRNMDPLFGWGPECRFSWGTAKELLDTKTAPVRIDWPAEGDDTLRMTDFFSSDAQNTGEDELATWYGRRVMEEVI